ncbi:MAG: glutamine-hydrolyzing GMP synthase [Leptospiraceae bacterium]|nr:glutamine-hydrolyzing GMP synthase [Leptospiraceae bacterium]MCZ8345463.1 glutamine-hydrolyzing GMP synthase [Leptospiraceae bacterium]
MESDKKIAVVDFGGQYSHLIASRVRRLGAYTEILSNEEKLEKYASYSGIILSGGPSSVYEKDSPQILPEIFQLGIPILGICYGHQLTMKILGGKVESTGESEYGPAEIQILDSNISNLSRSLSKTEKVWMSHGDEVVELPPGFSKIGSTDSCQYAMVSHESKKIYGIQFHPEVTHTIHGNILLSNFIKISGCKDTWNLQEFIQKEMEIIRRLVGERGKVFMLVSGGVDSTVAYLMLAKSLGAQRVKGLLVDTGFMRKNEVSGLRENLHKLGIDLTISDESQVFYNALVGKSDPEEKRLIVGNLFLEAQARAVEELNLDPKEWILGQGTIYPDTIESGGTKHSHKIKTHHNRVPAIQKMLDDGKIIEPLRDLYKDEVRELGNYLGLDTQWTDRHPFPGPGLVVRMIATKREVDSAIEKSIQQFFQKEGSNFICKVLPFPSVGVQGDQRSYANCLLINQFSQDWNLLDKIATSITNKFKEINRVVLLPNGLNSIRFPDSLEYTELHLNKEHSDLLREADFITNQFIYDHKITKEIWQMPVVLVPCGREKGKFSIILRPVESNEAMTANFYPMNWELLAKLCSDIQTIPQISDVFFDLTNKPPGTIEWE